MVNNPSPASEPWSPMNDQRDEAEFRGDVQENSSSKGNVAKKRKRTNQDIELDQIQGASSLCYEPTNENLNTKEKKEQNAKDGEDGVKEDYIHVRARCGQATNSHSLAERVRREKISERMKFLQDLVPGCSKEVTGKAVMLDEIINYVQSLQRQVEFLSMKLAAVNRRLDVNIEGLLSKDLLQMRGGSSSAIGFSPEMIRPQLHPSQQGLVQAEITVMANTSDALRRAINAQLPSVGGYKETLHQIPNAWEDDLYNVIQMNLGSNCSSTPES